MLYVKGSHFFIGFLGRSRNEVFVFVFVFIRVFLFYYVSDKATIAGD